MDRARLEALLNEVREGRTEVTEALDRLRILPFEDMGFAKLDHHRPLRTGMPEVIFASGKSIEHVTAIFVRMAQAGGNVLATRVSPECAQAVLEAEPRAVHHQTARCVTLEQVPAPVGKGTIAVVCAGTSDLPVAEEAAITARLMGNTVELIADVGVAGIHRLLAQRNLRRHGWGSTHGGWRVSERPGAGGPDKCGLWRKLRRSCGTAGNAEHVLSERVRGQHR
jgi:pyridinium-3,5-biscarboxylic acid mononucleotide synthase